jgi:hypothetical protein
MQWRRPTNRVPAYVPTVRRAVQNDRRVGRERPLVPSRLVPGVADAQYTEACSQPQTASWEDIPCRRCPHPHRGTRRVPPPGERRSRARGTDTHGEGPQPNRAGRTRVRHTRGSLTWLAGRFRVGCTGRRARPATSRSSPDMTASNVTRNVVSDASCAAKASAGGTAGRGSERSLSPGRDCRPGGRTNSSTRRRCRAATFRVRRLTRTASSPPAGGRSPARGLRSLPWR